MTSYEFWVESSEFFRRQHDNSDLSTHNSELSSGYGTLLRHDRTSERGEDHGLQRAHG